MWFLVVGYAERGCPANYPGPALWTERLPLIPVASRVRRAGAACCRRNFPIGGNPDGRDADSANGFAHFNLLHQLTPPSGDFNAIDVRGDADLVDNEDRAFPSGAS